MKSYKGLTSKQVLASRAKHGDNVLTPPQRRSLWSQFLEKFNDPLIKILLVALLLSVLMAAWEYFRLSESPGVLLEPVGIFVAVVLATMVGFVVEVKANRKFELLNKSNDDLLVTVKRDGHVRRVPRRDIVVGDVVLLEAGERVPADGILLDSVSLGVDESSLTGEPQAWKTHRLETVDSQHSTYPANVLLRGSTVMEGTGVMRVERVGDSTEYGRVATDSQIDSSVKTPLMQQLDRLGKVIAWASYAIAALIVVGRFVVFVFDDAIPLSDSVAVMKYAIETVMLAVTLIVVSVPEGLPMSITLSLALSMHRMLKTGNLVRRMHACETMGATTVICTDKTGTLTQNQMQVAHAVFDHPSAASEAQQPAGEITDMPAGMAGNLISMSMACNSTAHLDDTDPNHVKVVGNPTEGALLLWLRDHDVDYEQWREQCTIERQIPFSTDRKYMVTVVRTQQGHRLLLVKGAPEIVMGRCGLSDDDVAAQLRGFQRKAMRTLAFAYAELGGDVLADEALAAVPLHFLGYVAISDPVRPDVPAAIRDCLNAGVKVKIVTGDNPYTAREVARQVGIWSDADDADGQAIITGPEFAELTDEQALELVPHLKIMARARPGDKARLVEMLQRLNEVVAVTGDGTNDAPALKKAQVGLSMGDGTHVAREASDITILDNSFASINKAVLWGRSLYRNIQRFIIFQLAVNVCACLVVGVCSFMNEKAPLTVTQMLWVNLIMDTFAALALASLPPNSIVMRVPPRRQGESIITRSMWQFIAGTGGAFAAIMMAIFVYLVSYHADGVGLKAYVQSHISEWELAVFFTTFVMLQFWNLFNARAFETGHHAFHNIAGSRVFFGVAAVILLGQLLIVQVAYRMFGIAPLGWKIWALIISATSLVMWIGLIWALLKPKGRKP